MKKNIAFIVAIIILIILLVVVIGRLWSVENCIHELKTELSEQYLTNEQLVDEVKDLKQYKQWARNAAAHLRVFIREQGLNRRFENAPLPVRKLLESVMTVVPTSVF